MRRAWPWLIVAVVLAGALWWNARGSSSMERKSISTGGERREYAWFTPESVADDAGRHPVVIALHSLGMEGEGMAYVGAWGEPAQAGEFLVAFPDGLDDSWNAGTCCGASMRNEVDLPQPEGPTRTMNSPSPISRLSLSTDGWSAPG